MRDRASSGRPRSRAGRVFLFFVLALASLPAQQSRPSRGEERTAPPPPKDWVHEGETWLQNVRQHTFEGEKSGEAYFSPDQTAISFQSVRGDCPHYQIFVKKLDGTALWRVTPGKGLTTCSHWHPKAKRMIWASTHLDPETFGPPPVEKGPYAWARHPSFDIFESDLDGGNAKRLTSTPGYDAEGSYSADGSRICFTSERDGDAEIYTMASDGSDPKRVTNAKGYDGGPFFSPDGKRICFRGFRNPKSERLAYIYVIDADGKNETQLTFDDAVSWAPFWHPNGDVLVYSKNVEGHRNFELFLIRLSDKATIRITRNPAQDVLPVFSPDGKKLMWTSTRADGRSQIFVADFRLPTEEEWKGGTAEEAKRLLGAATPQPSPSAPPDLRPPPDAKRMFGDAARLADDSMQGRRPGTEGAANAADFIEGAFKASNAILPGGEGGTYRQTFDVLVDVEAGIANELKIGDDTVTAPDLVPMAFTTAHGGMADAAGPISFRGYGVSAPGVYDDYAGLPDVKGKIVLLFLRGIPDGLPSDNPHADPAGVQRNLRQGEGGEEKRGGRRGFRGGFAPARAERGRNCSAPRARTPTSACRLRVFRARPWRESSRSTAERWKGSRPRRRTERPRRASTSTWRRA